MTITTHPFDHVVVPLDGSPFSERALPIALAFAERLGAATDLIGIGGDHGVDERLRAQLDQLAHQVDGAFPATHIATASDALEPIRALSSQYPSPLVCVASHGCNRAGGVFVDALTGDLVGSTSLPILVVGPHARVPAADAPIVVCVDGSSYSETAIPVAAAWAERLGVELILVTVVDPRPAKPGTEDYLVSVAERSAASGIRLRPHVIRFVAYPAEGLALYLAEHPAQLVVLTTRARRGLTRILFGSVASRIVHEVSAPVLLLGPQAVDADPEVIIPWPDSPFATVIVPVDVADPSAPELRMARSLARKSQAKLVLAHIADEADVSDRQRAMTELADRLRPLRAEARVIQAADPAQAITDLTAKEPDSIVCMATKGPGVLSSTLLQTIAGPVVRWSNVPVMLIGPQCKQDPGEVAELAAFIDGSDVSDAVLALTGLLGQQWNLPVNVLEVVPPQARPGGNSDVVQDGFVLRAAARIREQYGVAATGATVDGTHVADSIADWAAEHPGSIIVLGSHGSGVSEERMGSVVMEVAHKSTVPVLVFPAHAASRQWQRFVSPDASHVESGRQ
jgi:nucleotide-binding universal stress UspA family protein